MTAISSSIPPSSTASLILAGWVRLERPDGLTPADFEQALRDLEIALKLEWKRIGQHVYVRWLS